MRRLLCGLASFWSCFSKAFYAPRREPCSLLSNALPRAPHDRAQRGHDWQPFRYPQPRGARPQSYDALQLLYGAPQPSNDARLLLMLP
jgi:hypothetical protein